jgi:hypothetical protein
VTPLEIIDAIEEQRAAMIEVSTGGYARIDELEPGYKERRAKIRHELAKLRLEDHNPYSNLRRWYDRWSAGDLPTYKSRRKFINDIYDPLVERLSDVLTIGSGLFKGVTGWERVDRVIDRIRKGLESASTEEDFQTIGLLCREALISVSQAVFDPVRHIFPDQLHVSTTDAKRMLEAIFNSELPGDSNDETRRHAKASLDLANALQHRRTAAFRDAALCAEATVSVVNIIAIIFGRRTPPT